MTWLPISRERYDEAVRIRDSRIESLEKELHRWLDIISKHHFGAQIFDTLAAETKPPVEPEPELTPDEQAAEEIESARARSRARLTSIRRTNPSQLGSALQREMNADMIRKAKAARPGPAAAIFAIAKEEALNQ